MRWWIHELSSSLLAHLSSFPDQYCPSSPVQQKLPTSPAEARAVSARLANSSAAPCSAWPALCSPRSACFVLNLRMHQCDRDQPAVLSLRLRKLVTSHMTSKACVMTLRCTADRRLLAPRVRPLNSSLNSQEVVDPTPLRPAQWPVSGRPIVHQRSGLADIPTVATPHNFPTQTRPHY